MTVWTRRLLLANVAAFFASYAFPQLWREMMFVPALFPVRPWTAVTYMFLHGGFWHLAFNMIALFFFGPRVEQRLGHRRFLWLYFLSGIAGAVLSFVLGFTRFSSLSTPIVGASGAVFGVLLAFAMHWPREPIYIWGVLPIEARWLVGIMTFLSLYGGFSGQAGGVAHFAHLGGFLGGYGYLKWSELRSPARRFRRQAESPGVRASDRELLRKWRLIDAGTLHEANRTAYDEIAAKIEEGGVGALTERERAFIERFSPG